LVGEEQVNHRRVIDDGCFGQWLEGAGWHCRMKCKGGTRCEMATREPIELFWRKL
jgi:hypothetical protein